MDAGTVAFLRQAGCTEVDHLRLGDLGIHGNGHLVDRACRPTREAAARGEDAGPADFLRAWTTLKAREGTRRRGP